MELALLLPVVALLLLAVLQVGLVARDLVLVTHAAPRSSPGGGRRPVAPERPRRARPWPSQRARSPTACGCGGEPSG